VLLSGTDEQGGSQVVLASQRYGRGKVIAFTLQDSWLWQMHASVSLEDQTHENLWRQLMRWLVDGVPSTVDVRTSTEHVEPGEAVIVEATVTDKAYDAVSDAKVQAHVSMPDGHIEKVALALSSERPGHYRGTFVSRMEGHYEVSVDAERAGTALGTGSVHVRAGASDAEYFNSAMKAETLRRIANDTGGRYYDASDVRGLAEDIRYGGRGVTTSEERDLWSLPIVLLVLMGLAFAEWGYRRAAGLA
jgi:hypothetical protein